MLNFSLIFSLIIIIAVLSSAVSVIIRIFKRRKEEEEEVKNNVLYFSKHKQHFPPVKTPPLPDEFADYEILPPENTE